MTDANLHEPRFGDDAPGWRRARLGEQAGCDRLGASVYELAPGGAMVFHYHLGREELLVALRGRPTLRTFAGERELREGEAVGCPRGPGGAHGVENRTNGPVRVLVVSEQTGPNVSVYPDSGEVGIFDAPHARDRRFGALFRLDDAISGYAGGEPEITSP